MTKGLHQTYVAIFLSSMSMFEASPVLARAGVGSVWLGAVAEITLFVGFSPTAWMILSPVAADRFRPNRNAAALGN
jgi:hypothetical protein